MLRTTVLRLKKVCSVSFIPRILRGDQCSATVSSAVIRKAHKSTKSTGDGEKASTDKSKDEHDYKFSSAAEPRIDDQFRKKIDEAAGLTSKTDNKNEQPVLTARLPLTHRDRCQKIIDEAFGEASDTQHNQVLSEQYFSHTVNLEDTRRQIQESEKARLKLQEQPVDNPLLPDNRSQCSIFKMSRELNANVDNCDEIIVTESVPAKEPDLSKNLENVKGPTLVNDERTHYLHQEATASGQPDTANVLNTTTAKEEEELLTQKLETIEETPVVEAQKPKLEGFNVTPRVLGNEPTLNCNIIENNQDKYSRQDFPKALDEVSKRCLKCPLGQIDEMLINEMEKLGMTFRRPHKAPSTPMGDDLVQMDVSNKQPISTIADQKIISESPELEEKENERATDSWIPEENEQTEALRKSEAIIKTTEEDAKDILYPEHIRIQIEPIACKSEEYDLADDYNSPTKFAFYYLPPTFRAAEIKHDIEETLSNSRIPTLYNQNEGPLSLDEPIHKGTLSETPNSHAFINNQNAEPYSVQSVEGDVLNETAQNAQTESATAEEETTPAENINTTIASVDPLHDASDNTRQERLLKPENKGPSYYAKLNASKAVDDDTAAHVLGHDHKASASKYENMPQTFSKEIDKVEHYGRTPTQLSTTDVQGELQENQTAANSLFVKVPQPKSLLPGENCNKKSKYSPTADNITQQSSKPEGDPEKANLPEEILKEHTLDPYYVLTCNETCPISPGSMSRNQNSDFVDTTETLYMKKNICESLRPKPQPIVKSANMSLDTHARPNVIQLENHPEIRRDDDPIGDEKKLSALLRKVRKRSRLAYTGVQSALDVQTVGKCGRKSPRCQPTGPRSPPTEPIPLPTFGLPKLKRRPPVCKPKKKPENKCSSCTTNDGGYYPVMPNVLVAAELCAVISKVNLTDEVIDRLQNLGKIFGGVLRQAKSNVEMLLAKDYEPWTPIPSWKIPPKPKKKEWRPGMHGVPPCVDGCPVFPKASASMNPQPPCNLKPCEGFPKRRSFTMLDCFTVSLGESKVYDLGEF